MKVSHTEVIEGRPADIFRAFEDPEVILAWQDSILEFEQLKGKFNTKGGVAYMKAQQVGFTSDLTVTTIARDGRKRMVQYRYEGAQAPFEILNTFTNVGDGTTEWTAELDVKLNLLTKALGPVLKPLAGELVKSNGKNFRTWCEANL